MSTILYQYWRSSASYRVRWALAKKGIPFESAPVDLLSGAQRSEEHLARNPMGHVPALFIDGHLLAESVAILEYLEETRPEPPLYPKTPLARARVRQVVELIASGVQPLQNLIVLGKVSKDHAEQRAWAAFFNERALVACEALLLRIDEELGAGQFAVGDQLTAADLFLVPQVGAARRFGVDVVKFPRVLRAEAAAMTDPYAAGALPESQSDAPAKKA